MAKMQAAAAAPATPTAAGPVSWTSVLLAAAAGYPELAAAADLAALAEVSSIQEELRSRKVQQAAAEAAVQLALGDLVSHASGQERQLLRCRALLLTAMQGGDQAAEQAQQALDAAEALMGQSQGHKAGGKGARAPASSSEDAAGAQHAAALAQGLLAAALAGQAVQQGLAARHARQEKQQEQQEQDPARAADQQLLPGALPEEVQQLWQQQAVHMRACLQLWGQLVHGSGQAWRYPQAELQLLVQLWHVAGLQGGRFFVTC
jgi:hypothetical protein